MSQKKQKKGYYKKDIEFQSKEIPKNTKFDISDEEEEQQPLDISYLLNLHTSSTSHLILKSEQQKYEKNISIINSSKYFNIDIKLLNCAIKSIPFNELYNIEKVLWTSEEISQMNEIAKKSEEIYKLSLDESYSKQNPTTPETKLSNKLDKLKIATIQSSVEQISTDNNNKESMEKWLDDVLDL